jgi:zinc protease
MSLKINFDQLTLANGLKIVLHQDHSTPIIALNIWYGVGSKNEVKGKTGFAHLFEHLMFQGSENVPPDMFFRLIQGVGGTLNGSTSFDRTNYFETLPSQYLELALWLESDRMGNFLPTLTKDKFENQREVVKNERLQQVDNQPYGDWAEQIFSLAFPPAFPYHWPVIGYMEDLDNSEVSDAISFFKTWYKPSNASLALSGDFQKSEAIDMIKMYFEGIPSGVATPKFTKVFDGYNTGEKRKTVFGDVSLPRLYMAYHVPKGGEKGSYIADMISDIFSEGRSSKLFRSLVYRKEVAQEAYSFLFSMLEASLLLFVVTPKPHVSIEKIENELQAEIDSLFNEKIFSSELERVKNNITAKKIREMQSISHLSNLLNAGSIYFDNPGFFNKEHEIYHSIELDDIKRFAQKYILNNNRTVLQYLPNEFKKDEK